MPSPFPIVVGQDDTATENRTIDGFTFFFLPKAYHDEFVTRTAALLDRLPFGSFHGKKYKSACRDGYADFLRLAYGFIAKSPQAMFVLRVYSPEVKQNIRAFGDRVVADAVHQSAAADSAAGMIVPYFEPLAALATVASTLAPNVVMEVKMDRDSGYAGLNSGVTTSSSGSDGDGAGEVALHRLIRATYNAYAAELSADTPQLAANGIRVSRSSQSPMIQAADVMGNFAKAALQVRLGHNGRKHIEKTEILREVLGEQFDGLDNLADKLELDDQDVKLREPGAISFKVGWVITRPPDDRALLEGRRLTDTVWGGAATD